MVDERTAGRGSNVGGIGVSIVRWTPFSTSLPAYTRVTNHTNRMNIRLSIRNPRALLSYYSYHKPITTTILVLVMLPQLVIDYEED
jgi:hypothetical protein